MKESNWSSSRKWRNGRNKKLLWTKKKTLNIKSCGPKLLKAKKAMTTTSLRKIKTNPTLVMLSMKSQAVAVCKSYYNLN